MSDKLASLMALGMENQQIKQHIENLQKAYDNKELEISASINNGYDMADHIVTFESRKNLMKPILEAIINVLEEEYWENIQTIKKLSEEM